MMNSFFIVVFAMCCAHQVWMVSGQNCTASDQPPYSDACIFECIKDLYDKQYCVNCSVHAPPILLLKNDTLENLVKYQFLRFDDNKKTIVSLPSCNGCHSDETADLIYTEYIQPRELEDFVDLTYLTVKSHHSKINHTIVQQVDGLYANITERFDETKIWCMKALGITEKYEAMKEKVNSAKNADIASKTEPAVTTIETLTEKPSNQSNETSVNPSIQQHQSNKSANVDENLKEDDEFSGTTTVVVPVQTPAGVQNEKSNMRNVSSVSMDQTPESTKNSTAMKKNKPKLHEHHYNHSVAIIVIIAAILIIILVVSVVILSVYIKHRKGMKTHLTSSRTYVFDNQN